MTTDKEEIARGAADTWCRCFKCDEVVNATGSPCEKPLATCRGWYDAYRGALLALDILERRTEQLPANLDEAAEDFVWEVMENDEDGISELSKKLHPSSKISDYYDALAEFFKAGARWMAEQGNSIQCEIDWYEGPYPDFTEEQQVELCKGFKPGDKIIVQIRKAE